MTNGIYKNSATNNITITPVAQLIILYQKLYHLKN